MGTASRALSGVGHVRKETLARVRTAAESLGYYPNEIARSLRVRQSHVVAIVVPDIGSPFMIGCIRAMQRVLREHRYMSVLIITDGDSATEKEEIEYLIQRQIDGFLVVPADSSAPHFVSPKLASKPVVFFDQPLGDENAGAVLVKNRQAAYTAVRHLIEHGHKRIACIGVDRHLYSICERMQGYRDAMNEAALPECLAVPGPEAIDTQVDEWLHMENPPTAIFSLSELSSIKVVEALAVRGVRMPGQIAFIGFDEVPFADSLDTPLTVVAQPATTIGEQAALTLLERIEAGNALPGKQVLLDAILVRRSSCGCR
jgi:LacI family transcriptional regulator